MHKGDVSKGELAYREALRIANIGFERARSQADGEDLVGALERTTRDQVRRLAGRILIRPRDVDADGALWFHLDRPA